MAAKKVLKLIVKAKGGGTRTKYFKTQKSYNKWKKEGRGNVSGKTNAQANRGFSKAKKARLAENAKAIASEGKRLKKAAAKATKEYNLLKRNPPKGYKGKSGFKRQKEYQAELKKAKRKMDEAKSDSWGHADEGFSVGDLSSGGLTGR